MSETISTGFYPFWFWNDRITEQEVRWQIAEMARQGIKGFFIHSRQGLKQPYLSDSFFQMVDVAIEAAEEHGMVVCLYDEYPYPSGVAGGEVVLGNPKYVGTRLVHYSQEVDGGPVRLVLPAGKVLSVKAFPVQDGRVDFSDGIDLRDHVGIVLTEDSYVETGLTAYNRKRYFASEPRPVLEVTLPPKRFKIYASCQAEIRLHKYFGTFTDVLNPEAIETFMALTHERYRSRYKDKLGSTIAGIFVDEVEPGWSDCIPQLFEEKYGYDLCEYMPALQDPSHPDHVRVSYDLYRLKYELFCERFERRISEWCAQNGISYCGEKPALRLSQLRYMDIPGCDCGHKKAGDGLDVLQANIRGNARAVVSAAYFYGKKASLCECYHSLGWGATLQDAKFIAEALLISGVNCLVPHGFFYSTHGLRKHDAPPSFFFQMPYFELFKHLSDRVERIGKLLEGSYIDAKVLVVEPHSGVPNAAGASLYASVLQGLAENHIDFLIVDTDILDTGTIQDGFVKIKDVSSTVVIVPAMRMVEGQLRDWLNAFRISGGHVIEFSDRVRPDAVLALVRQIVQPSLSVQKDGKELAEVYMVRRVSDGGSVWLLLNTSDKPVEAEVWVGWDLAAQGIELKEIPLDPNVPVGLKKLDRHYTRVIRPFELVAIQGVANSSADASGSPDAEAGATSGQSDCPVIEVQVPADAAIKLLNKNLLRMYEWKMSLLDEDGNVLQSATVPAVPISDQLEKGGFRYAPVNLKFFGAVPRLDWPKLRIRYEFSFSSEYDGQVELVMEPGSIVGDWTISVNDSGPIGQTEFAPTTAHVRGSLGVDITAYLKPGSNRICVDLASAKANHGLLNCLYLAGDFGVRLDPLCLVPQRKTGVFESYVENLIPYYAGVLEYTAEFDLPSLPQSEEVYLNLRYPADFREATEVSVNGGDFRPVLWEPRCIRVKTNRLQVGKNTLVTRVYTTLIRSFEGEI